MFTVKTTGERKRQAKKVLSRRSLEDGVDEDGGRRRRDVHDVDVDQLLVLTLSVLQDNLVQCYETFSAVIYETS